MYSPESKKLALTRIKEIFETYSDFEHPLTQNDIAEHLDHDYGINIDRKTIGRNISLLKETGIEIESAKSIVTCLPRATPICASCSAVRARTWPR